MCSLPVPDVAHMLLGRVPEGFKSLSEVVFQIDGKLT